MLGYLTISRNREKHFHCHKITFITAASSLIILYVGLHNSRMVTLDLGKFADVKRVTFRRIM